MARLPVLALCALMLLPTMGASAEAAWTQTQAYGPTHYAAYSCTFEEEHYPEPQWGNCFDVPSAAASASVVIEDASGLPVEFAYSVYDAHGGGIVFHESACSTAVLALPAGAAVLDVWPTFGGEGTCEAPVDAPATVGTITVTFG